MASAHGAMSGIVPHALSVSELTLSVSPSLSAVRHTAGASRHRSNFVSPQGKLLRASETATFKATYREMTCLKALVALCILPCLAALQVDRSVSREIGRSSPRPHLPCVSLFGFGSKWKEISSRSSSGDVISVSADVESPSDPGLDSLQQISSEDSPPLSLSVSVLSSISKIPEDEWDACAEDAAGGPGARNPFVSHGFLQCLEESHSAVKEEGWLPMHLAARDSQGKLLGVLPLYLKTHSYGEYVFDHSWASAFQRYGGSYYPKLQSCVPFTPVTGPRLLVRRGPLRQAVISGLCQALKQVCHEYKVSSAHVTFPSHDDWKALSHHGFLQRTGMQYHWENRGYKSFDDFLMDLKQSKRKNIRQERKRVASQGIKLKRLRGSEISNDAWNTFYKFYRNTTDQKWGQAYLTRSFFPLLGERLGDSVLLVTAEDSTGRIVGGALNLVGGDALYGRNWGCLPGADFPFLHFEACYYQAIEGAIELGLSRVEAGAQGEHKVHRGYLPTPTFSAHYIPDRDFRGAVSDFLRRESAQMQYTMAVLHEEASPFKDPSRADPAQLQARSPKLVEGPNEEN